jgi:hypothetical protein
LRSRQQRHRTEGAGLDGESADRAIMDVAEIGIRVPDLTFQARSGIEDPKDWQGVILWGHTKNGPFVILEGNKR